MVRTTRKDPNIENDIEEIHQFIARDDPRVALMVVEAIVDTMRDIGKFPEMGSAVELNLNSGSAIRRRRIPGYRSFSIYYSLSKSEIRFLCIHHAARDGKTLEKRIRAEK